jgi:hypothetical protein
MGVPSDGLLLGLAEALEQANPAAIGREGIDVVDDELVAPRSGPRWWKPSGNSPRHRSEKPRGLGRAEFGRGRVVLGPFQGRDSHRRHRNHAELKPGAPA